jgi:O-antigen/teichoic acid export membrane protein
LSTEDGVQHTGVDGTEHQTEVRRSVRESCVYLVSKLVPFVFNLLFIKFYTNWFSPETVGRYEIVLALGMVASSLGAGWLQMSLLRLYPEWERKGALSVLTLAIAIGFLCSTVVGAAAFFAAWWISGSTVGEVLRFDLMGWALPVYLAHSFFMVSSTFLRAQRRVISFSVVSSLTSLLNFIGGAGLTFLLGSFLLALVMGTGASLVLPGVLALFIGWRTIRSGEISSRLSGQTKRCLVSLFSFGLPLSLNQVCSQLLNLSDRYVILVLRGEAEAGIYSATYRLADFAVRFAILALMMSAYTAVTETYEKSGREAAERLVTSLSRFYVIVAAPLAVGMGLVQQDAMKLFTGPEFLDGAGLLVWIAFGDFFLGLSQYQHFGLHLGRRTMRLALLTLSATLLNLVLNLVFVPEYGYKAAAYTTFASFVFLSIAAPILARPWLAWRFPAKSVAKVAAALAAMAVVVTLLSTVSGNSPARLTIQVVAGAFTYAGTLLVLGEVTNLSRGVAPGFDV